MTNNVMKRLISTLIIAFVCAFISNAQETQYQNQLDAIQKAFNDKNIAILDGMLSDDCTVLGNSGNLLLPSLKAMYATLANNTIDNMTLISSEATPDDGMLLKYKIKYSVLGEKDACFGFDENGKIVQLDYLTGAKSQTVKKYQRIKRLLLLS